MIVVRLNGLKIPAAADKSVRRRPSKEDAQVSAMLCQGVVSEARFGYVPVWMILQCLSLVENLLQQRS